MACIRQRCRPATQQQYRNARAGKVGWRAFADVDDHMIDKFRSQVLETPDGFRPRCRIHSMAVQSLKRYAIVRNSEETGRDSRKLGGSASRHQNADSRMRTVSICETHRPVVARVPQTRSRNEWDCSAPQELSRSDGWWLLPRWHPAREAATRPEFSLCSASLM